MTTDFATSAEQMRSGGETRVPEAGTGHLRKGQGMKFLKIKGGAPTLRTSSLMKIGAVAAAGALLLAACSSGGSSDSSGGSESASDSSSSTSEAAGGGAAPPEHVCAIGGADAFFAVLKNGADMASEAVIQAGNEYTWIPLPNYDNIGPDMVKLIEQAVAQNCTALAAPVWDAAAEVPALQAAIDSGVQVYMYNSGLPHLADKDGNCEAGEYCLAAEGYYGTDEYLAGVAAGEYFVTGGAKNIRCVNTQPGAVNWQQRCGGLVDGATAGGIQADQIKLPPETFGDAAAITAAVQAELAKDPTIDGFATGSSADADAVAAALEAVGSNAMTGGWDVSENVINRIAEGKQLFAVDQQGWYQGWLAVSQAWMGSQYSIFPAGRIILTGPALITKDNAAAVLAGTKDGFR
jgi:simple sugar transport system substrate-binding protein